VGFHVPGANEAPVPVAGARPLLSLQALADRKVLDLYGPPGVVINEHMEILHFRGRTGPYLDPAPGAASFNLLRLARPELHMELKRAIQEALAKQLRVSVETMLREDGKAAGGVRMDVVPIQEPESRVRCLLVLFQKLPPPKEVPVLIPGQGEPGEALGPLAERIQELEHELALTKEYLQTTLEEKESANEELKSANEELQSSNEELQSTNEELETSKEEMQSSNEELTTVNEELQNRMEELSVANDDLHNFLAGVDNAVVIAGMDLRIRRYTAAAEKLLNLVPGDVGRSINFLDSFVGDAEMASRVSSVVATLSPLEHEILASNHRYYNLRITPYKTLDHSIRGAVISLLDIDLWKRTADLTKDAAAYADNFLGVVDHPLLIIDGRLRVVWANASFYATFHLAADEIVGNSFSNIADRRWSDNNLRGLLESTVATGKSFRSLQIRHGVPGNGEKAMRIGAARVPTVTESVMVLVSIDEEPDPPEKR
jgi:two-component system CheB/CheR fusion protein